MTLWFHWPRSFICSIRPIKLKTMIYLLKHLQNLKYLILYLAIFFLYRRRQDITSEDLKISFGYGSIPNNLLKHLHNSATQWRWDKNYKEKWTSYLGNLISNCRSKRHLSAGRCISDFIMLGIMRFVMALAMQTKERPSDTLLGQVNFLCYCRHLFLI